MLDLLPVLEFLSKVKDVRTRIREIISKLTQKYDPEEELNEIGFEDDENIKIEDREKYIQVIGNYHGEEEIYNPAKLSRNGPLQSNTMMTSKSIRFSNEEVNAFVFNHVHCQYSSNEPVDQVLFDHELEDTEQNRRRNNPRNQKGFFKKVQESFNDSSSEDSVDEVKKKENYSSNHDSDNSFAQELYKNLEDPSSVTESFNSEFQNDPGNNRISNKKENDELKTFF